MGNGIDEEEVADRGRFLARLTAGKGTSSCSEGGLDESGLDTDRLRCDGLLSDLAGRRALCSSKLFDKGDAGSTLVELIELLELLKCLRGDWARLANSGLSASVAFIDNALLGFARCLF